ISGCRRFMYEPDEARRIVADMASRISEGWHKALKQAGMSGRDCDALQPAFVYPGFFESE
ncbi:MAG: hypothetical protein FWF82_06285, partial [Oscillospiraceae bacterium]|nr:hypothetical protein [Oscillospiraceae bacterium]